MSNVEIDWEIGRQVVEKEVGDLDAVRYAFMIHNLRLAIFMTERARHVNTTTV